jgi:hypothetical protein
MSEQSYAITARVSLGQDTRQLLPEIIKSLEAHMKAETSEQLKFVLLWQLTLATTAWDVSEAAIMIGSQGSVRAARLLNRCLSEYAYRTHQYSSSPKRAEKDGLQARAMARKLMEPAASNLKRTMSDAEYAAFKAYLDAAPPALSFTKLRKMMNATLTRMGVKDTSREEFLAWLEVEYTLGSGMVHGSQVALLDTFRKAENGSFERGERSPHFQRQDELIRTAASLILLIAAIELYHGEDFGGRALVQRMEHEFFGEHRLVTVWQHDALLPLLGVRRS